MRDCVVVDRRSGVVFYDSRKQGPEKLDPALVSRQPPIDISLLPEDEQERGRQVLANLAWEDGQIYLFDGLPVEPPRHGQEVTQEQLVVIERLKRERRDRFRFRAGLGRRMR